MILSILLAAALAPARAADMAPVAGVELPAVLPAPPSLPAAALPAAAVLESRSVSVTAAIPEPAALNPAPVAAAVSLENASAALSSGQKPGSEAAREVSSALFDKAAGPDGALLPEVENAARISREIEEPSHILRQHGIQAVIAVYGSARIPSPENARAGMKAVLERYGRRPKSVAGRKALGQARRDEANSRYYELARRFGELVARGGKGRIAIVTGGGPGIMEAANRGAFEAGGPSIGYNIKLPREQKPNPYITPGLSIDFEFFSPRKMNMRHDAVAMTFFPGGFGTMDELFEVLTLMQTGKIPKAPIVLVGEKRYWDKVLDFESFSKMGLISENDLKLFRFAETAQAAWKIVNGHAARAK